MESETIETFCNDKGKQIAKAFADKYDEAYYFQIDNEIYEISLSYSRIFILKINLFLQK